MKVTINGADRSSGYQTAELEAISVVLVADQGQPGIGSLPIPGPYTQETYSGQQAKLAVGATVIVDGLAGALTRDRGGTAMDERLVHTHALVDDNAFLDGHRAIGWKRPAETDRARMLAFNADFLGHLSLDTTWVLNTHNVTIPAKTYTTETLFSELQTDCGDPTGKTLFIERRRLHWHLPTEGYVADIAIVEAEAQDYVNSFACEAKSPPARSKDPIDLAVDVVARNSKGQTRSALDTTAQTRHDSAGGRHEVLVDGGDGDTTFLQTLANATLAARKAERVTYEGEIGPMTAAQVVRIPVGCLINVTDKVWGLSSSTQRIAEETIRYIHPDKFMVKVSLGYPVRIRFKPPKTTPPVPLQPFVCTPNSFEVLGGVPWECVVAGGGDTGCFSANGSGVGTHLYGGATYAIQYTVFHSANSGGLIASISSSPGLTDTSAAEVNMGATRDAGILFAPGSPPAVIYAETTYTPPGDDDFRVWLNGGVGAIGIVDEDSSISARIFYLSGPDPRFNTLPPCTNGAPATGQPVNDPTSSGDGTTTTGLHTLAGIAYRPGSLEVFVNGLLWPGVIETDPTTGEYALTYPVPLGADLVVKYVAS